MCLDIHALRFNKDLHTNIIVSLFVVGDWVSGALLRFIKLKLLLLSHVYIVCKFCSFRVCEPA